MIRWTGLLDEEAFLTLLFIDVNVYVLVGTISGVIQNLTKATFCFCIGAYLS